MLGFVQHFLYIKKLGNDFLVFLVLVKTCYGLSPKKCLGHIIITYCKTIPTIQPNEIIKFLKYKLLY